MTKKLFKWVHKRQCVLIVAIISSLITLTAYTKNEQNEAITKFEQSIFVCKNSFSEILDDMWSGRDYSVLPVKDGASHMNQCREQVQGIFRQQDALYDVRPSILYLSDLYKYILVDDLENTEEFAVCLEPFLQTQIEDGLWTFLDDLDKCLQTDAGVKAYVALTDYFVGGLTEPQFASYCCKYAYFSGIPCIHEDK